MALDVALLAESEIHDRLPRAEPAGKRAERSAKVLGLRREGVGPLAGEADQALDDDRRAKCGEELRTGRLHLAEAEPLEFFHGEVDFRGRDVALPAQGGRVGDAERHERSERAPLVKGEAGFVKEAKIGAANHAAFYSTK